MSKKKFKDADLPIYECMIDEQDESTGFQLISIVQDPAIGVKAMKFSDLENVKIEMKAYKDDSEEEMKLAGPILIPNIKIYRNDKYGEYYIVFKADQIRKMVRKFNKSGTNRKINFNHSNKMVDAFIEQDFFIEDPVYNGARKYGFQDLPVGTYFIVCQVEDENFWNDYVSEEGFTGFSVEGYFGMKLIQLESHINSEIDNIISQIEEIQSILRNGNS